MKPLLVILIDDDPGILNIGKKYLEADGSILIDTALSAEEALLKISQSRYEVIVCDYRMPPGMDAIGLASVLKDRGLEIPLIVFSAWDIDEIPFYERKSRLMYFLQKTGRPAAVYAELKKMIQSLAGKKDRPSS